MPQTRGNDLVLGTIAGSSRPKTFPAALRAKHLYIAGATGMGKSKLLEYLIRQDILQSRRSGCGMLVIDPHGSLYDNTIAWLARHKVDRPIVPIDLRQDDWVISYNVLRQRASANPSVVVENFVDAIAHVWGQSGTDATPLFARWAGNTLHALYERGFTLADAIHLFSDQTHVRAAMTSGLREPISRRDWDMANSLRPKEFEDQVGSTINRLRRFLGNESLRCIFGQTTASLDLGKAIDEGAIILVSLAREKGRVSRTDADLFATLLLSDLWTAAQERGKKAGLKPFYVYLDEFQRFVTPTIAEGLDEARGFGLHLTLAHQFPNQLINEGPHGRKVFDSAMENATSKIVFRLTDPSNLEPLARMLFLGVMDPDEIKHKLHTTKVMEYQEELRKTRSTGHSQSHGVAEHESASSGAATGHTESFRAEEDDPEGRLETTSDYSAQSAGRAHSWTEGSTESETESTILVPIMGEEVSSVQFRSLEEQIHRAMVALFDQQERHFTARLAGERAPSPVLTPEVSTPRVRPERAHTYLSEQLRDLPFALTASRALQQLQERESTFVHTLLAANASREPVTSRRPMRGP